MTQNQITTAVCTAWQITEDELMGYRRTQRIADARHYACWLMRNRMNMTYEAIAKVFRRSHPTVLHSVAVVNWQWLEQPRVYPISNERMKVADWMLKGCDDETQC